MVNIVHLFLKVASLIFVICIFCYGIAENTIFYTIYNYWNIIILATTIISKWLVEDQITRIKCECCFSELLGCCDGRCHLEQRNYNHVDL